VGGIFQNMSGDGTESSTNGRGGIAQLNPDGSLTPFNPGAPSAGLGVVSLVVQSDGKILVGGDFVTITPLSPNRIGRLNGDGSLDLSFNPGANNAINAVAIQADGRILVGGQFTTLGGGGIGSVPRNFIARLAIDGSVDSFDPSANASVRAIVVQP